MWHRRSLSSIFQNLGWVEHDAGEIWSTQLSVAREAMNQIEATAEDIAAIGITNQRETTIVWDKNTGQPVYHAIVWQCRRTSEYCDSLKAKGLEEKFRQKTGLVIDAYFSATKVKWILDNVEGARERAEKGELLFGTVETWLIWKLTKGAVHVTDYSNASRTMMFNINTLEWDDEILKELNIPKCMLRQVKESSEIYGETYPSFFGEESRWLVRPVISRRRCSVRPALRKVRRRIHMEPVVFLLMNAGDKPVFSKNGLVTTIGWGLNGKDHLCSGRFRYLLQVLQSSGSVMSCIWWIPLQIRNILRKSTGCKRVLCCGGVYRTWSSVLGSVCAWYYLRSDPWCE